MGNRVENNNPWSILFVGGCLSIIATIKGVINLIIGAIYLCIPCTCISLYYLPRNFYDSYYTLITSPYLGPNLTILAFISMWIPIILYPFLVFFGSLFLGIGAGFIYPFGATFDDDELLLTSGFYETFKKENEWIKEMNTFNGESYQDLMTSYQNNTKSADSAAQPIAPGGAAPKPFDIAIHILIWCLFIGCLCGIITGIGCILVFTLYLLPLTLKCYYYFWKAYFEDSCKNCVSFTWLIVLFAPFIVGNVLLPILTILVWVIACIGSIFYGAFCMFICYNEGASQAFDKSFQIISEALELVNKFMSHK